MRHAPLRYTVRLALAIPALLGCVAVGLASPEPLNAREPDLSAYAALLRAYVKPAVREGVQLAVVDYPRLKADPRFLQTVETIRNHPTAALQGRNEQLAYYINLYNIAALNVVAQNWPIRSINQLTRGQDVIWKRPVIRVGARNLSLDQIEHEILRPLGEPRIHFAVVCASISCPDLRREVYTAARLDAQLEEQTQLFFLNPTKGVRVNSALPHFSATKLLEWFAADFQAAGGPAAFVRRYRRDLPANLQLKTDIEYNWNLNY
jgi:Protein of unknown function, DUF547